MNLNVNNIEKDMEVYGSDGEKIGSIVEVYSGTGGDASASDFGQGAPADVVVEQVDIVDVTPDYATGTGSAGTVSPGGIGGSDRTGLGSMAGTTPGTGTTGDIGGIGTVDDQSTSPGYVAGGAGVATVTGSGYIHVRQGGILGIGAKDLYIPISEILDIDPGNCVSLSINKHQADNDFQTKPDSLGTPHT